MKSIWYWRLKVEWEVRQFFGTIGRGAWLVAGDMLWHLAVYRDCYYAYRQRAWRAAQAAQTFDVWLQSGGLLAPWVKDGQR
ncbi:MAG: hypothetical protein IAE79_17590 [Anaerolinea sp.]|nr:hypothetical protein [Anaerolinea sp.]